ncbi:hypothetical protein [uncultured Roseobacter sp.]|uniref:hypothetical protein n=1 Tax=uncultured Roseobacter sp. TaxID=114847 RepID=UPI0026040814|nr:hypothetical protein [uncultured Roseobacter sp.]
MSEIEEAISRAWKNARPSKSYVPVVFAALIGCSVGWIAHNYYWRANDLDYALVRATTTTANCKNISLGEQVRRVEERIGKPRSLFTLDDKLVALDFVFDRLELANCFRPTGR